jgi:small basic protein
MRIKAYIPGLLVIGVIALFSTYLSTLHASFDALVISIIIGMFFGNLLGDRGLFREGTELGVRLFLPIGIALYGTQLSGDRHEGRHVPQHLPGLCLAVLSDVCPCTVISSEPQHHGAARVRAFHLRRLRDSRHITPDRGQA